MDWTSPDKITLILNYFVYVTIMWNTNTTTTFWTLKIKIIDL